MYTFLLKNKLCFLNFPVLIDVANIADGNTKKNRFIYIYIKRVLLNHMCKGQEDRWKQRKLKTQHSAMEKKHKTRKNKDEMQHSLNTRLPESHDENIKKKNSKVETQNMDINTKLEDALAYYARDVL